MAVNFQKRKIHIEADVATIGPNLAQTFPNGNVGVNQVVRATINFPRAFNVAPFVTANTLQDPAFPDARDTFAVSILNIDRNSFTVNIRRVDVNESSTTITPPSFTWAQNLQLSWIAVGNPVLLVPTPQPSPCAPVEAEKSEKSADKKSDKTDDKSKSKSSSKSLVKKK